jgi:uncharacterized membrane protein YkvI
MLLIVVKYFTTAHNFVSYFLIIIHATAYLCTLDMLSDVQNMYNKCNVQSSKSPCWLQFRVGNWYLVVD